MTQNADLVHACAHCDKIEPLVRKCRHGWICEPCSLDLDYVSGVIDPSPNGRPGI